MAESKQQLLAQLHEGFRHWEEFLASLNEEQITAQTLSGGMSIKDIVAHLWAWQERSVERLRAALADREPEFPGWPADSDMESRDLDAINARIHAANRDKPWTQVYADWRDRYLQFMALAEQVPEADLLTPGRFDWLEGEPLTLVLRSGYRHHYDDHLKPLLQEFR